MTDRLFVKTRFADSLVRDLPNAGLTGVKVADDIVRVEPYFADEDPEDLKFELGWHAEKLGIAGFWAGPADTTFEDGVPVVPEPEPEPSPRRDYDVPLWDDKEVQ